MDLGHAPARPSCAEEIVLPALTIWIYYDEVHHRGRPHFHARYGDAEASFDIRSFELIAGEFPLRARRLVAEWGRAHQFELSKNWERAREHQPLIPIEPLK